MKAKDFIQLLEYGKAFKTPKAKRTKKIEDRISYADIDISMLLHKKLEEAQVLEKLLKDHEKIHKKRRRKKRNSSGQWPTFPTFLVATLRAVFQPVRPASELAELPLAGSGTNFGIYDDNDPRKTIRPRPTTSCPPEPGGISWRAYQEDIMPGYVPLANTNNYAVRHNPFVYFDDVTGTNNRITPTASLTSGLTKNWPPTSPITPLPVIISSRQTSKMTVTIPFRPITTRPGRSITGWPLNFPNPRLARLFK